MSRDTEAEQLAASLMELLGRGDLLGAVRWVAEMLVDAEARADRLEERLERLGESPPGAVERTVEPQNHPEAARGEGVEPPRSATARKVGRR